MAACLLFLGAIAAATTAAAGVIHLEDLTRPDQSSTSRRLTISSETGVDAVDSELLFDGCQGAPDELQDAVDLMISPCSTVPEGRAAFSIRFQPDGSIELASPTGDSNTGMVPTCALQAGLKHTMPLKAVCRVNVSLSES